MNLLPYGFGFLVNLQLNFSSVFISLNPTNYTELFDYANSKIEHIFLSSTFSEIIIQGDFHTRQ